MMFESSVNSEGIETLYFDVHSDTEFESSVNSEGIETKKENADTRCRLRAV